MNKTIISILLLLNFLTISINCFEPTLFSFFSLPIDQTSLITFNRISLEDGSLNVTLYSRNEYNLKFMGTYAYDGSNDFYFGTHGNGGGYFDGTFSDLDQGELIVDYMNYDYCYPRITDFTIHPMTWDGPLSYRFYVGWSIKTNELLILGFDTSDDNYYFYYNTTDYKVSEQYQNSLVHTFDPIGQNIFINWINPSTNQRTILEQRVLYSNGQDFQEYQFSNDLIPVENRVYLMQSSVGGASFNNLFMIEVTNGTTDSSNDQSSKINFYSLQLLNNQATNKLLLSFDNSAGSIDDGIPFSYVNNSDPFFFMVYKPSSPTQYSISKIDLTTYEIISTITTDITDKNNYGLYYH